MDKIAAGLVADGILSGVLSRSFSVESAMSFTGAYIGTTEAASPSFGDAAVG